MNRPRAFISYSSNDRQCALALAEELRRRGIEIWIDYEHVGYGDSIPSKVSDGLLDADVMLLLMSKSWLSSSWCRAEYETQIKKEIESKTISVLPIIIDDVDIPPLLSTKMYVDARRGIDIDTLDLLSFRITQLASCHTVFSLAGLPESQMLDPFRPSYDSSLLCLIISKTLKEFPPRVISDISVLEGRTIIDLYRVVNSFIDSFLDLVSVVVDTLAGYASLDRQRTAKSSTVRSSLRREVIHAKRVNQFIIDSNRRLIAISGDMRMLAKSLNAIIDRRINLGRHFEALGRICVQVSVLSIGITVNLGAPQELEHLKEPTYEAYSEVADWPNDIGLGSKASFAELNRLLDDLIHYREQLQTTIAEVIAGEAVRDAH